jgi:hypothetical protein
MEIILIPQQVNDFNKRNPEKQRRVLKKLFSIYVYDDLSNLLIFKLS